MIRAPRLVVSRPMYAFKPSTWREESPGWFVADAVWFRRKQGRTVASMGVYRPTLMRYDQKPTDGLYESWIAAADDNRYGGDCLGRWDGERYWGAQEPATIAAHLELLRPMLADYPDVPPSFDGWWMFPKEGSR